MQPVLKIVLMAFAGLPLVTASQTYTTRFEGTEDPLSEGGAWTNAGVDWTQIRKATGLAFGTQTGTNTGSAKYNDSFAHLVGFPPDQEAWGQVRIKNPNAPCVQELEILLRWTSSPHRTTGYECFARCVSSDASYVQIVRWDGPLGKFTYLADNRGTNYGLKNGDILKASITGNRIAVYINGVEKAHAVDDSFKTGNPGIGEYYDCNARKDVGSNADFGFSSFTAKGLEGAARTSSEETKLSSNAATAAALEGYAVSDLDRVFKDGFGSPRHRQTSLTLFGLRNETVSGQCVFLANQDLKDLTLSVSPLRQGQGSAFIPARNVRWNFVGSVFIEKNSPNRQKETLLRPAPAWFPDYLSADRVCSLRNGESQAIYLTLKIPPETPAGEYRASVTAVAATNSVSLPLVLHVYPLNLPEDRHLFVTEWFSTSEFAKHHSLAAGDEEGFYRLLKLYARNMADHRQNVFRLGLDLITSRSGADGKLNYDFSRFDRMAHVFWDSGRMNLLETGFVAQFGKGGWSGSEIVLDPFPVQDANGRRDSIPGEDFLAQLLPAFVAHLREKGWLDKTVFHIADEPSDHNIIAWRRASEFVHQLAPQLRRIDAIETPHCLGGLEIWVPKLDHLATWQTAYEDAQRQGNELWFYTVGIYQGGSLLNKTVDVPLIETRLMHWLNYRYNLRGYLHWGFNAWTDDPIKSPGQHRGDGWHVYPTKDGLLDSLRWEQMRNGLQDYECLWLLENKIAEMKKDLPAHVASFIDARQRSVEIASRVIADYYTHTQDPEVLYQARRQAIEETLTLDQAPRVLLQTTPLEHTTVAKGCVIDLHGWAAPGTTLTANGESIPVAQDGLFLAQISALPKGDIVLEARDSSGVKKVLRQFQTLSANLR
jgi:hypothetical protein